MKSSFPFILAAVVVVMSAPVSTGAEKIPPPAQWSAPTAPADTTHGKKIYFEYCKFCHGNHGKGDGPSGKALPVNPANFTDKDFMTLEPDEELFNAISGGASAVGESPFMPAFGYVLKTRDIQDVLAYLRTLCRCEYDPTRAAEHEEHEQTHREHKK